MLGAMDTDPVSRRIVQSDEERSISIILDTHSVRKGMRPLGGILYATYSEYALRGAVVGISLLVSEFMASSDRNRKNEVIACVLYLWVLPR